MSKPIICHCAWCEENRGQKPSCPICHKSVEYITFEHGHIARPRCHVAHCSDIMCKGIFRREYSDAPLAWCHCVWCEGNRPGGSVWNGFVEVKVASDKVEPIPEGMWDVYHRQAIEAGIEVHRHYHSPESWDITPAAKEMHEKFSSWWNAEYKAAKDDGETLTGVDFSNGKDTGCYVEIFHLPGGRSRGVNEPEAEGSAASQIGQMIVSKVAHFETVTNPDGSLRYIALVSNEPKRKRAKRRNRNG